GEDLPQYFKDHMIYYAGPAKTPRGRASGSFGPTTAGRMDSYVDLFQSRGGSMVMLAKGNRSMQVRDACQRHGGFYLGSIGGPAARLADHSIKKVAVQEYEELGMEAIWRIEVEDFPAFIVTDDKGNDFYAGLMQRRPTPTLRVQGEEGFASVGQPAEARADPSAPGPRVEVVVPARGLAAFVGIGERVVEIAEEVIPAPVHEHRHHDRPEPAGVGLELDSAAEPVQGLLLR